MRFLIILFLISNCSNKLFSQKIVAGHIKDTLGSPLSNITVKLYQTDSNYKKLIGFDISNISGSYQIKLPSEGTNFFLETSAISYQSSNFNFSRKEDTADLVKDFYLTPSINYLDTVNIKYSFKVKVSGDTISFNPKAYELKNENNIEELISRLPGIAIDNTGKIFFNGTPISSVLINGDDLFKDNYQELTRNASPDIIKTIDIIKNYQKDKLLRESDISNGQVINLNLKKKYSHYTFANLKGEIDQKKSWLAEAFAMHLQNKAKIEGRYNFNNIGFTSFNQNEKNAVIYSSDSKRNFISFTPIKYLINLDNYFSKDIPSIYQNFNTTKELTINSLFKLKKKWELTTNINFSNDSLNHHQISTYFYPNDSSLTREVYKNEKRTICKYDISANKLSPKYSLYFDLAYNHEKLNNLLVVKQSLIPKNEQTLHNLNNLLSFNFNFNKQLYKNLLLVNSASINLQDIQQNYQIDSSYRFWFLPIDFNLYQLSSIQKNKLMQIAYRSKAYFKNGPNKSNFEIFYTQEGFKFISNLQLSLHASELTDTNFVNNNYTIDRIYGCQYSFQHTINEKSQLSALFKNSINTLNIWQNENYHRYSYWLPDYSFSYDFEINKINKATITLSYAKKIVNIDQIFTKKLVDNNNSLLAGYSKPNSNSIFSIEARHILTDLLGSQWFSFTVFKISDITQYYIPSFSNGFYYYNYFTMYPNSDKQLFVANSTQKLFNNLFFKMNANVNFFYNNFLSLRNNQLQHSILSSIAATIGFKSTLNGKLNFAIESNINSQSNKIISPHIAKYRTVTTMRTFSLFYVANKNFYINSEIKNITNSFRGYNSYYFWNIALTKKILKEKLQLELIGKNLLNKKEFSNNFVTSFYTQKNSIFLRGRQLIINLKYSIR